MVQIRRKKAPATLLRKAKEGVCRQENDDSFLPFHSRYKGLRAEHNTLKSKKISLVYTPRIFLGVTC